MVAETYRYCLELLANFWWPEVLIAVAVRRVGSLIVPIAQCASAILRAAPERGTPERHLRREQLDVWAAQRRNQMCSRALSTLHGECPRAPVPLARAQANRSRCVRNGQ